ncbi:type VII toxin-antitoxin system MntA family adenylyltransferase antitoxin [Aestuariibacter salexigens]|uniref:type VII toxin-antitoxin system MntA family adenylyltransferase antitoxin n=1 Tax=Aestuariibacter salexigens TaxID=226010 RepID=UPI000417306B|nr:nucleotidyltransferase domain-containing protein [Aestuariibacter salexigens]
MSNLPIEDIIETLQHEFSTVRLIYVFGSQATGQSTKDSDIDIAILTDAPLDNLSRWDIAQKLASMLDKDVDLVDLKTCSTILQHEIVMHGQLLYDPDNTAPQFENTVMSMYQHLSESRAAMVEDMLEKYRA